MSMGIFKRILDCFRSASRQSLFYTENLSFYTKSLFLYKKISRHDIGWNVVVCMLFSLVCVVCCVFLFENSMMSG